eukprot:113293_1
MAQLPTEETKNKEETVLISSPSRKYSGCEESKLILSDNDPNVVCKIRRKRASNLIVYRAITIIETDENGQINTFFHPNRQIEIFWLKLSKNDLKKHRDSGKMDDRVAVSRIERKLVYGVSLKKIKKKNKHKKSRLRWRSKSKSKKK